MQLHGGAQEPLQQSIVQFLRYPGALRETLFESHIHLLLQPQHTKPKEQQHCKCHDQNTGNPEPPGLPVGAFNFKGNDGLRTVPQTVAVAGNYPKTIRARTEIVISDLPRRDRLTPIVVETVKLIFISNTLRNRQTQRGVVESDAASRLSEAHGFFNLNRVSVCG